MRALAALALVLLAGCGERAAAPDRPEPSPRADREREQGRPPRDPMVEPASCPATLVGCEEARGTILFVERRDPDGDGDAHFVLSSKQSVTGPGISVIDVRADLRPKPLPGPGDQLSGAGLVQRGSFGQRQIEAVAVNTGRR